MTHPFFLAGISGFLLPLALPNELFLFGSPVLGFVCLVPLFLAVAKSGTPGQAAAASAIFAAISTPIGNYWLAFFKDYALLTIGSVTIAYTLLFAVYGAFLWRFSRPGPYRPFLIAAFWTIYEFIKSTGYLAYPWGLVAYPVNTLLPFLQIADIAGIWPISFVMALANSLLAETLIAGRRRTLPGWMFFAVLAAGFTGYGFHRMSVPPPSAGTLRVVLVQQNTDPWMYDGQEENLLMAQELSRRGIGELAGKADLVIWSESSLFRPYSENKARFETFPKSDPLAPFVRSLGVPLLTGNPLVNRDADIRRVQNGVILLDSNADIVDSYGKRHPVPMAEHVPFWEWKPVREFFRNVVGLDSIWDLGDRDTIFRVRSAEGGEIRFGAPICFEDAFPYLCRRFVLGGADLLINLTNDSWSRTNSAQIQHFVVARFRSLEMKRVLVRSTNGGLTSIIGPFGEIIDSLPMFEESFLARDIRISREKHPTPYTLFGDYLPVLLSVLLVLFLLRNRREESLSA